MAASAAEDGHATKAETQPQVVEHAGNQAVNEVSLVQPSSVVKGKGRERHDAPRAEPSEADEFGLPVKPARRRNYSLDELESPEEVKASVLERMKNMKGDRISEEAGGSTPKVDEGVVENEASESTGSMPVETTTEREVSPKASRPSGEHRSSSRPTSSDIHRTPPKASAVSEWSHQQLAPKPDEQDEEDDESQWQDMPALAEHRMYDDWGKVIAKSYDEVPDETVAYGTLGGAGKGYTKVQLDEDAQSATSLDDTTAYLFKDHLASNTLADEDDADAQDIAAQMRTTKELLTEAQRIAYVGVVRLSIRDMEEALDELDKTLKHTKKVIELATEALKMWGQKMMVRVYQHMEISTQEQIMVEQLAEHGVQPSDLTHTLMQNARVKTTKSEEKPKDETDESRRPSGVTSPRPSSIAPPDDEKSAAASTEKLEEHSAPGPAPPETPPPPVYEEKSAADLTIKNPEELENIKAIDLDLRWTVLCDLFLLLIADSTYDARSRTLLEKVGFALSIPWQEVCRFEKRITDALEMQEQAEKENWNEDEHMKNREKAARNKRLMVMGLCTVGGGIIIGLSAGALAPVIGAGLAAGFTGIGIAGTGGFLGGTGAAALIGTTGTLIGGGIGMKTSERRTGAVRTFEYKPLFNNKRANLIVNVAGWMAGKVDDVRLPFSTVDPVMGDIYSVNWEPEMLQSTGQTIQILGTEALTQTIQQILGATFLATLMAGLSLPIVLTKLSYLIDNPWTVSLTRADATGLILADSLIDRNLGPRPITLVGFSLGSRVIFSCLKELAKRGAIGLIQNVYMFGSPVVVKREEWTRARTVVSGRFLNAYATNDWILAYLFRATSGGIMRIAGLGEVGIPGVENVNVTEWVPGHMAYRGMMPTLLHQVGWLVESEEFTEIEDPDPENHEKRQRELIGEIEEARKMMEEKPEKKGFWAALSLSGRQKRAAERKGWETYDERSQKILEGQLEEKESERLAAESAAVMFDVDAIRREALALAMEGGDLEEIKAHLQVREIESTLPALKIESPKVSQEARFNRTSSELGRARTHDGSIRADAESSRHAHANGVNGHLTPSKMSVDHQAGKDDQHQQLDEAEPEVTMSFDDSPVYERERERPSLAPRSTTNDPYADAREQPLPKSEAPPPRPALRSVQTTPAPAATSAAAPVQSPAETTSPDHNPWAEEEEMGQGGDVKMSFD